MISLTAALSAAVSALVSGVNVLLWLCLLGAMMLDLASGLLKAVILAPRGFDWWDGRRFIRGAASKGLIVVGCIAAGLIEIASFYVPEWGTFASEITPIQKVALAYGIVGQLASVFRNVAVVKEARLLSAFMLRRMDAIKLGSEPPARRHYDPVAIEYEDELRTIGGIPFRQAARQRDRDRQE